MLLDRVLARLQIHFKSNFAVFTCITGTMVRFDAMHGAAAPDAEALMLFLAPDDFAP